MSEVNNKIIEQLSTENYVIFNDDCFNILKEIADNSCDVAFTSPPYNRKRDDKYEFFTDIIDDYLIFLSDFTDELLRICKKYIIVNVQQTYYNKIDVFKYIGKYADKIKDIVIWEKSNPRPVVGNSITNAWEFFIILGNTELKSNYHYTKNHITTSINTNMPKEHKAVMKQEVADWFIKNFTQENDIIIDPFMGVGTTGISCMATNRKFVGIEIDNIYCKMSQNSFSGSRYLDDYSKENLF